MANLEEVHRLQKLAAIEQISFNKQLRCVVSFSLTTLFMVFPFSGSFAIFNQSPEIKDFLGWSWTPRVDLVHPLGILSSYLISE